MTELPAQTGRPAQMGRWHKYMSLKLMVAGIVVAEQGGLEFRRTAKHLQNMMVFKLFKSSSSQMWKRMSET